jgi:hypothetical protein
MSPAEEMKLGASKAFSGFLIAPLAPCVIIFVISLGEGGGDGGIMAMSLTVPVSYIGSAVIGLPLHIFLKRRGYKSIYSYIVAGALGALFAFVALVGYPFIMTYGAAPSSRGISGFEVFLLGIMISFGALIAAVFWLVVRPDRRGATRKPSP